MLNLFMEYIGDEEDNGSDLKKIFIVIVLVIVRNEIFFRYLIM